MKNVIILSPNFHNLNIDSLDDSIRLKGGVVRIESNMEKCIYLPEPCMESSESDTDRANVFDMCQKQATRLKPLSVNCDDI